MVNTPSDGGATGSAGMPVTVPATHRPGRGDAGRARSLSPGRGAPTHPARGPSRWAFSHPAGVVDPVQVAGAPLVVHDAEALLRGEREDADLALVGVGVDVERGLTGLVEGVDLGQRRVDQALGDQPVGLPRLAV